MQRDTQFAIDRDGNVVHRVPHAEESRAAGGVVGVRGGLGGFWESGSVVVSEFNGECERSSGGRYGA